jgi:transcriptional regulator with XRE-family HTH domain
MPRLKVRELAEAQGLNMSQLQRKSGVTMPSVRRYWYNTRDGKSEGEPIHEVDLTVLAAIAAALGVKSRDLFTDEDWAALYLAVV